MNRPTEEIEAARVHSDAHSYRPTRFAAFLAGIDWVRARINPPSPIDTWQYRIAPAGEGELSFTWKDKPHRLIYDLCGEIERLRDEAAGKESKEQAGGVYCADCGGVCLGMFDRACRCYEQPDPFDPYTFQADTGYLQ